MQVYPHNSLISMQFTQKVADIRARASVVAEEAVSGRYKDLTKQLSGNIGQAMLGQKALDDINTQRSVLSLRSARLDLTQNTLGRIHDSATGIDTQMLSALGMGDDTMRNLAARDARSALEEVFNSLNVRHGDRYLFSGNATDTQAVTGLDTLISDIRQIAITATSPADFETQLDDYFNSPTGGWQTTIYAGTQTVSDTDSVMANDPAIMELVSGLAVLAISTSPGTPPLLEQNQDLITSAALRIGSGRVAVTNLRSDVGVIQQQVASSQKGLDTEEIVLTGIYNDLTGRDQFEAASELKLLEASLEASYILTSRLSGLSLLNFLR